MNGYLVEANLTEKLLVPFRSWLKDKLNSRVTNHPCPTRVQICPLRSIVSGVLHWWNKEDPPPLADIDDLKQTVESFCRVSGFRRREQNYSLHLEKIKIKHKENIN